MMTISPPPMLRVALTPAEVAEILDDPDGNRQHLSDVIEPLLNEPGEIHPDVLASACSIAFVLGDYDEVPRLQELLEARAFEAVVVSLPYLVVAGVSQLEDGTLGLAMDLTPPQKRHCGVFRAP